jgi:flavin reductase (DIM6/NTAB) family NADH-FMN oxidoreductase RutF
LLTTGNADRLVPDITPDAFRGVMSIFATGVTVVALTNALGEPYGFSVNAFTSVSLSPPEVLVCIDRNVTGHPYFQVGTIFSVHILGVDQRNLCQRFITKGIDRFDRLSVGRTPSGAPLIPDVLATLECRVTNIFPASDHDIFLAAVQWFQSKEGAPLIFHRGKFAGLAPLPLNKAL